MIQRPVYQTALALLTVAAFAGGLWLLVAPGGGPRMELTIPTPEPPAVTGSSTDSTPPTDVIDINLATARELADGLAGIGPVLSERIVAYREENGPFVRTDQLMGVDGVGPITYDRIRELVTVGE